MKKITSVTIWDDSTGRRISITYNEIDEQTRKITRDNVRENYVLIDSDEVDATGSVLTLAQRILDVS